MKDFFTRKREYLENLRNNELLLQGIMGNRNNNSPEMTTIIFDPKTEGELNIAICITTILSDTLNMFYEDGNTEIEDYNKEPIMDLFRKTILAQRDNNERVLNYLKEEITRETTPESLGELAYNMIKVFGINYEEAFEYLASQTGYDLYDEIGAITFDAQFKKANELINKMMPSVEVKGKIDIENEELILYYTRFSKAFHKAFQKDFQQDYGLHK